MRRLVASESLLEIGGFKCISAIFIGDVAGLGLVALVFAEFTGLVMYESCNVISSRCRAVIATIAFVNKMQVTRARNCINAEAFC